jgi:hypothetical protein
VGFEPKVERFVETVVEWAGNVRDVSVFGWQAAMVQEAPRKIIRVS